MLIPYDLLRNKIHRVQSFVFHIVLDVLCKPNLATNFSSSLVLPKYKNLIDGTKPEYLLDPISEAYLICKTLNKKDLKILRTAVYNNNRIQELCDSQIRPVYYTDIENISANLSDALKRFCDFLYNKSIHKAPFYSIFGKIEDYYNDIVGRSLTCRFCGTGDILTEFHSKRGALDHYFPKGLYPFCSVNFSNLIPICDTCNSKYKLAQDPIRTKKKINKGVQIGNKRTKAFYPFLKTIPNIEISIGLKKPYSLSIRPNDLIIDLHCKGFEEQVETWNRLFGIKENYAAICCSKEMYSYKEEIYTALVNLGISHDKYIELLRNNKYSDKNVVKIPFLNAIAK